MGFRIETAVVSQSGDGLPLVEATPSPLSREFSLAINTIARLSLDRVLRNLSSDVRLATITRSCRSAKSSGVLESAGSDCQDSGVALLRLADIYARRSDERYVRTASRRFGGTA